MNYYVIFRNLQGEVYPGKAIIVSEYSYQTLKSHLDFFEYFIGPFASYEYEQATNICERNNDVFQN